jgi:exopolysaccharide biosynthesis protein
MNHLKRLVSFFLTVVCSLGICLGQNKMAGTFYVYDYAEIPALTPAPEGYTPFYVSHFGRHGARYCTSEYDQVYGWFSKAADENLLTEAGKAFFSRYKKFYSNVKDCKGNLTGVGKAQHRAIAAHMVERFPEVFEGPTHVEAVSTESARVIMSMWSFLSSLQSLDSEIDVNADASAKYAPWLQPSLSSNPYLIKDAFNNGKVAEEAFRVYFENTVPWKEIAGKFFTGADVLETVFKTTPVKFIDSFYSVVSGTYCLDQEQGCFDDVLTAEEAAAIWKGLSADYYLAVANYIGSENHRLEYAAFTLGQMIEMADADIASGSTQLRLRFGHDSGIAPLMVLLGVNGCGHATASFEESLEIFPSYYIPMGASVQLVFYKKAGADVLVKVLVNEQEATLPMEPVSGPYYSWTAFKAHYMPFIREAKRHLATIEPMAALQKVDWGWKAIEGTQVEVGNASVDVFGSTQNISIARFPMWVHSISIVESDGPDAAVTSKMGADHKALAAINGSYFNMKTLEPVTYVKDEGKVLCSVTTDGAYRCNGMLRIKDKKGKKVDIVSVDSLSTIGAAKGWREAIVSGPVLIEDGKPVIYENDGSRNYSNFYARRHPRTLLGYTADGWMYFIAVDGRFPEGIGMSIDELEVLCESLGLYEALNLDGGGSTTLWSSESGVVNHPYDNKKFDHEGERAVPNIVIVK